MHRRAVARWAQLALCGRLCRLRATAADAAGDTTAAPGHALATLATAALATTNNTATHAAFAASALAAATVTTPTRQPHPMRRQSLRQL